MFARQEVNLIRELVINEFKLKYKNSALGFFWSFLRPMSMLAVLYIVFNLFIKINVKDYALFLLFGIISWNFFAECTSVGLSSITSKSNIVKKINFKYEILVLSAGLTSFISFLLNFLVFFIILLFTKGLPKLIALYILLPVSGLLLIGFGLSFMLSTLFMKYRDISYVWEALLQILFWLTPIAYPIEVVPATYLRFYMLNPLAIIITVSRELIINSRLTYVNLLILSMIIALIILIFGYTIYKRYHKGMIEYL